jgi:Fe-S-cluster-containing dehydrogenase component
MSWTRREFLMTAGAMAAGAAARPLCCKASEAFSGNPDRFGVLTDTTLCIGLNCRRCEIACARENGLPPIEKPAEDESVFDEVRRMHADQFTVVNRFDNPEPGQPPVYVKKQCMHCDEPACASACPVKAFRKTPEGAVIYNEHVCIGCRYCMVACPFEIPAYEYDRALEPRVRKCTLCWATRVREGRQPACVEACPKEVMIFGKRSELLVLAHQRIMSQPGRYVDHIYGEHEAGGTSWLYLSSVPYEHTGLPVDLAAAPYPELTRTYLSAAPLVMTLWPAFFAGLYVFSKRREELRRPPGENDGKGGGQ